MPTPLEIAVAALREIYEAGYDVGFPFCGTAKRALQAIEAATPQTGGGDELPKPTYAPGRKPHAASAICSRARFATFAEQK